MKIPDEFIDPINEIGKKMREQSNRMTQYPLFVIHDKKRVYHVNSSEADGKERREEENFGWDDMRDFICGSCEALFDDDKELPEDCDSCDDGAFIYFKEYDEIDDSAGVFITEESCESHIEENRHHYDEPKSFVISAWRNPEMVLIMQTILRMTGDGEIPSHYK